MLDRTKEPGATGEPLYLDVVAALAHGDFGRERARRCRASFGGRYGLSSKDFDPRRPSAVLFDELKKPDARKTAIHGRHQ